jgi:hypothetical protein
VENVGGVLARPFNQFIPQQPASSVTVRDKYALVSTRVDEGVLFEFLDEFSHRILGASVISYRECVCGGAREVPKRCNIWQPPSDSRVQGDCELWGVPEGLQDEVEPAAVIEPRYRRV